MPFSRIDVSVPGIQGPLDSAIRFIVCHFVNLNRNKHRSRPWKEGTHAEAELGDTSSIEHLQKGQCERRNGEEGVPLSLDQFSG